MTTEEAENILLDRHDRALAAIRNYVREESKEHTSETIGYTLNQLRVEEEKATKELLRFRNVMAAVNRSTA